MNIRQAVATLAVALAVSVPAYAAGPGTPLAPAGTVSLNSLGAISGTFKADKSAPAASPGFKVESAVLQETKANNPLGGLTFLFQVNDLNAAGLTGEIATNFAGYLTNVGYAKSATDTSSANMGAFVLGTINPSSAQRNGNSLSSATAITFDFNTTQGTKTSILVVQTNATKFKETTDSVTRKSGTATAFGSYTPAGAVAPEPASFAVFGFIGVGLLSLMVRARRGKAQLAA